MPLPSVKGHVRELEAARPAHLPQLGIGGLEPTAQRPLEKDVPRDGALSRQFIRADDGEHFLQACTALASDGEKRVLKVAQLPVTAHLARLAWSV
jgi:hypothetical protein